MSTTNPKAPDDSKNSKMTFNDVHNDPSLEHGGGAIYLMGYHSCDYLSYVAKVKGIFHI